MTRNANFQKIKSIVEDNTSRTGRIFDAAIQLLILYSLVTFCVETLPNLSQNAREWLKVSERITVAIFTIEYLLRIVVADRKRRFIFSFFGLVDFFAIIPFYIAVGIDLRGIRVFRFLRIFRALKALRYNRAIHRFGNALLTIRTELALFTGVTLFLLFVAATGIYYFENPAQPEKFASIFHSLWWAIATLTTVGYGDVYPVTADGKIFTFFMLIAGLGVIAVPTGLLSSALTKTLDAEQENGNTTDDLKGKE